MDLKEGFAYKTILCSFFSKDRNCHRGQACSFAHGEHDLLCPDIGSYTQAQKQRFNYKTALCQHWAASGTCPRGSTCTFAHGEGELKQPGKIMIATDPIDKPSFTSTSIKSNTRLWSGSRQE